MSLVMIAVAQDFLLSGKNEAVADSLLKIPKHKQQTISYTLKSPNQDQWKTMLKKTKKQTGVHMNSYWWWYSWRQPISFSRCLNVEEEKQEDEQISSQLSVMSDFTMIFIMEIKPSCAYISAGLMFCHTTSAKETPKFLVFCQLIMVVQMLNIDVWLLIYTPGLATTPPLQA